MALSPDYLIERRILGRRVSFWRWASALIVVASVVIIGLVSVGGADWSHKTGHIAKVKISGIITGDET